MGEEAAASASLLSGSSLTGHINEDESNTRKTDPCVQGLLDQDTSQPVLSNISSSPASFPLFSKLPSEIRCQIWLKSVSDHRTVSIIYKKDDFSYAPRIGPPAIIQVNRESRHEGLKVYHELLLGSVPVQYCYVDLTRDIVFLKDNIQYSDIISSNGETLHSRGRLADLPPHPGANPLPPAPHFTMFEDQDANEAMISRRHSKVIFYDLLSSVDGPAMLRNFHVHRATWSSLHKYYHNWRHRLPASVELKRLVLVHERGKGYLRDDLELLPVRSLPEDLENDPLYREDRVALRLLQSFIASQRYLNKLDLKNGRASVLNYTVEARYLERGDM